jgi:KUP system potassium uptake protein
VLHAQNLVVTVTLATAPYVAEADRVTVERLDDRFVLVDMAFGYMEEPNVARALARVRKLGVRFDIMATSFFLSRRAFRSHPTQGLPRWQEGLFVGMARSASDATTFYHLPSDRVIEIGHQITI